MIISYTPEAIGDLIRLREFIEHKNPEAAQRISKALRKGITQLKAFPNIGVEVVEAPNPEIVRDLILGNYIVRYLLTTSEVHILRIWHHKENRL
jgi:plasmid stabilization system protein ParE